MNDEQSEPFLTAPVERKLSTITVDRLSWFTLSVVSLMHGIICTMPLAILLPHSLDVGVDTSHAAWIISAWPVSTLLTTLILPNLRHIPSKTFLLLMGLIEALGFASFYVELEHVYYLPMAVLVRLISGTAHFLLRNKFMTGLMAVLSGDVNRSSLTWEVCYSAGTACGAYIGSVVSHWIGFPLTMATTGAAVLANVVGATLIFPAEPDHDKDAVESRGNALQFYKLHLKCNQVLYAWVPMICIGACMVFVEGILTHFYNSQYSKTLEFGGIVLGVSGVVYTTSAAILGSLRSCFPCLAECFLVLGLVGAGAALLFIGPLVEVPGVSDVTVSVVGVCFLLVSSCAVQLNSLTVSANALSTSAHEVSGEVAMSVTMNTVCLAYHFGAFVGPVIGVQFSEMWGYAVAFACGAPFFWLSALTVFSYLGVCCNFLTSPRGYFSVQQQES